MKNYISIFICIYQFSSKDILFTIEMNDQLLVYIYIETRSYISRTNCFLFCLLCAEINCVMKTMNQGRKNCVRKCWYPL